MVVFPNCRPRFPPVKMRLVHEEFFGDLGDFGGSCAMMEQVTRIANRKVKTDLRAICKGKNNEGMAADVILLYIWKKCKVMNIVITGAGKGIGYETAKRLCANHSVLA